MTVGTTDNFSQTRDEICADALQTIGKLGEGELPTANALAYCANQLNKMIKHWETQGVHLWTTSFGTVFTRVGISKYILSSSGDKACDDSTLVETTLTVSGSGTGLTVASTTGMTANDNIGIELDDGTRQWTNIVSVDSSTTITINAALTGAAGIGNTVFSYTTNLGRILKVIDATYRVSEDSDLSMGVIGREQYFRVTTKNAPGTSNIVHYMPQRDTGLLYVWPVPNDVSQRIKISYIRSILDFDQGSDNPDLPQEWLDGITLNLSRRIGPAYGVNLSKDFPDVIRLADQAYEELKAWDNDIGSIMIVPEDFE